MYELKVNTSFYNGESTINKWYFKQYSDIQVRQEYALPIKNIQVFIYPKDAPTDIQANCTIGIPEKYNIDNVSTNIEIVNGILRCELKYCCNDKKRSYVTEIEIFEKRERIR